MLDFKFIKDNRDLVAKAISLKNIDLNIDELIEVQQKLQNYKNQMQELQTERNANAKSLPKAPAEEKQKLIERGREIGESIELLKPEVQALENLFQDLMLLVPSVPSEKAPIGKSDADNVEVKRWGEIPQFTFKPLDHVQILEKRGWAEFDRIAEVCGGRSYSLKNEMVLLEMAFHRLALEKLQSKKFTLLTAPALVREKALVGTGHFPTGKEQVYFLPKDDLYLSGTAEVQMNSMHSGEILKESDLPILYAGHSPCFRREAGSYGRDVRGLIRVHQFLKTEQYVICKNDPEESEKWHQTLLQTAEEIMQELEIPYRIVECCTGDMGTGKVRMYDIEGWVPSEQKYRETHSCSSLHEWQARRSQLRYRNSEGKVVYCHTLNNTAIATPRILVPFLEVHQCEDGTVKLPKVFQNIFGRTHL